MLDLSNCKSIESLWTTIGDLKHLKLMPQHGWEESWNSCHHKTFRV
jgi:hypothetical protein